MKNSTHSVSPDEKIGLSEFSQFKLSFISSYRNNVADDDIYLLIEKDWMIHEEH